METRIKDYSVPIITYKTFSLSAPNTGFLYRDLENNKWLLTARHNLYPLPDYVTSLPSPHPYREALIVKLVMKFRSNRAYSLGWELTQRDLLDHGRISPHQEVDLAAINLIELSENKPGCEEYYSNKYFFDTRNLSNVHYDIGNDVIILGFPSYYDFRNNTCPIAFSGKIVAVGENDLHHNYRPFVFAVDAACPQGVSGSPVILNRMNNCNGIILLGSYCGYIPENKIGIISCANLICKTIRDGVRLHKEKWRSG